MSRFFCGPHAKKSAALAKQQKKRKGKGKTVEGDEESGAEEAEDMAKAEEEEEDLKGKVKAGMKGKGKRKADVKGNAKGKGKTAAKRPAKKKKRNDVEVCTFARFFCKSHGFDVCGNNSMCVFACLEAEYMLQYICCCNPVQDTIRLKPSDC